MLVALLAAVLLFAQLAAAAYACPGLARPAAAADDCGGHDHAAMDPEQPQLCRVSCDPGDPAPQTRAGVAAVFGVIMPDHLVNALQDCVGQGLAPTLAVVQDAIREGAVLRVRPKAMTVATLLAGLLPIVWSSGTGAEIMSRIAAPMLGGMVTAPLLSLFVVPAAYALMRGRGK